jgi:hypothetical protein
MILRIHPIPRCSTLRNQFRPRNQFHPISEFRFHSIISTNSTTIEFQAIPEFLGIPSNSVQFRNSVSPSPSCCLVWSNIPREQASDSGAELNGIGGNCMQLDRCRVGWLRTEFRNWMELIPECATSRNRMTAHDFWIHGSRTGLKTRCRIFFTIRLMIENK